MHSTSNASFRNALDVAPRSGCDGIRRSRRLGVGALAALALGASTLLAAPALAVGDAAPPALDAKTEAAIAQAEGLSRAFRHAAATIAPSVVSIESIKHAVDRPAMQRGSRGRQMPAVPGAPGVDPEDLFRRFFGEGGPRGPMPAPMPGAPEMRGQGSGVIVSGDGLIVTNNHVVAGADQLRVTLDDGRTYDATVVGTDPETDLALIRIEGEGLPAARFGDSDELEPGDWVVAVGSPFGLDKTVTSGIVSAKQRANVGVALFEDFIQTDAAINPGNSGGPLVNLRGEVIGINTAIRSRTGGNDGIGFAIPVSTVKTVAEGLRSGRVERGYLGIAVQPLDEQLASSFGYSGSGVVVTDVVEGEAAHKAGLQPGDILKSVDGRSVDSPLSLVNAVASKAPGAAAKLELVRDGEPLAMEVLLGARPGQPTLARRDGGRGLDPIAPLASRGVRVGALDDEQRNAFGIPDLEGIVVLEVAPGSPAALAELAPGDVILAIGASRIATLADAAEALRGTTDGQPLRLRVRSGDSVRFVVLR